MTASNHRFFALTGLGIGLVGGLTTLALGSSCDVECLPDDRPSILLRFQTAVGTARVPQTATSVTYRFRGFDEDGDAIEDALTTPIADEPGYCLDRECTRWVVGTDQAGIFDIDAVVCGKTYHQQVRVPLAADDCHPELQHVAMEVTCNEQSEPPIRDTPGCDKMARPSTFVFVGQMGDDYLQPVAVDRVWYEHAGRTEEATCAGPDTEADGCAVWTAGWEIEGPITVFTQWCDTVVSETVVVGRTADGCHVDTEFVMLPVSTRGCLTGGTPAGPGDPTPHSGPGSLTDEPPDSAATPSGSNTLRNPMPPGDPVGPHLRG